MTYQWYPIDPRGPPTLRNYISYVNMKNRFCITRTSSKAADPDSSWAIRSLVESYTGMGFAQGNEEGWKTTEVTYKDTPFPSPTCASLESRGAPAYIIRGTAHALEAHINPRAHYQLVGLFFDLDNIHYKCAALSTSCSSPSRRRASFFSPPSLFPSRWLLYYLISYVPLVEPLLDLISFQGNSLPLKWLLHLPKTPTINILSLAEVPAVLRPLAVPANTGLRPFWSRARPLAAPAST